MVTKAKKTTGTKRAAAKGAKVVKRAGKVPEKPAAAARGTMRGAPGVVAAPRARDADSATQEDLLRLREATETTYRKLREIDEDLLPEARREEYWRNRHIARAAWEHAENAEFENLVEQQKEQLPAVRASNARLAKDVETTATILGVLDVVSASLGILASVITLLA